jgi:hypothetical protein
MPFSEILQLHMPSSFPLVPFGDFIEKGMAVFGAIPKQDVSLVGHRGMH